MLVLQEESNFRISDLTENSFMNQWGRGPRGVGWVETLRWRSHGIQGTDGISVFANRV